MTQGYNFRDEYWNRVWVLNQLPLATRDTPFRYFRDQQSNSLEKWSASVKQLFNFVGNLKSLHPNNINEQEELLRKVEQSYPTWVKALKYLLSRTATFAGSRS